jgi:hypothetical protein
MYLKTRDHSHAAVSRINEHLGSGQFAGPCSCCSGRLGLDGIGSLYANSASGGNTNNKGCVSTFTVGNFSYTSHSLNNSQKNLIASIARDIFGGVGTVPLLRQLKEVKIIGYSSGTRNLESHANQRAANVLNELTRQLQGLGATVEDIAKIALGDPVTQQVASQSQSDPNFRKVMICLMTLRPPKKRPAKPKKPVTSPSIPVILNCSSIAGSDVNNDKVRLAWLEAKGWVAQARVRLRDLAAISDEAVRGDKWNKGDEGVWFGGYKRANFTKIQRNFDRIWEVLTNPKLEIRCVERSSCNWKQNCCNNCEDSKSKECLWGSARLNSFRAKRITIFLNDIWFHCHDEPYERVQTLIHEAAHISGVSNIREGKKYGAACAKKLAQRNCFQAAKNADNYGYYAMASVYKSANPNDCKHFFARRLC